MSAEYEPKPITAEQLEATTEMVKLIRPDLTDETAIEVAKVVIPFADEAAISRSSDEDRTKAAREKVAEVFAIADQ